MWGNEPKQYKILELQEPQPEPETKHQYLNTQGTQHQEEEPPADTTPILDEKSETETATTHTEEPEQNDDNFIIPDITKEKKQTDDVLNVDIDDDKTYSCYKELTIKELADNTTRKDQILKRIAEHNLKADTAKLNCYKDKTARPDYTEELSGIFLR